MNQKVVLFTLSKLNCDITAVITGAEALESFKNNFYDLILMDIMLPDTNGYDVTTEIRKYEELSGSERKVPIVALTANTYDNDKIKCIEVGMNEYLAKPFTSLQLITTVEKYIGE